MLALNFVPDEMLAGGIHINPVIGGFLYGVAAMAVLIFVVALFGSLNVKE